MDLNKPAALKIFKYLLVFLSVSLLVISISLSAKIVSAQVPQPPVPCDKTENPEFNSLRPYQASPCQKKASNLSYSCGNTLVVKDEITVYPTYSSACSIDENAKTITCPYTVPRSLSISVDTSQSQLPIAGNTELVPNSSSDKSQLSNADRVNEYLSWYLNGTVNRAEEEPLDSSVSDINTIINFAGPIKKLLPLDIQHFVQIAQIKSAGSTRHNQIAVCAHMQILGLLGKSIPIKCYDGNGNPANGDVYRLSDWQGNLSWFNTLSNTLVGLLVDGFAKILPFVDREVIKELVGGDHWNKKIPPLPWNFNDPQLYLKAYQEWRGKSCIIIPVVKLLICIDNPLVPNKYADLFPYVPLSSTEDLKGSLTVETPQKSSDSEVDITDIVFTGDNTSTLNFPHMAENSQLADTLQTTYLPKGVGNSSGSDIQPPEFTSGCKILQVRSNSGDKLFGEKTDGNLSYIAHFNCTFPLSASPSATPVASPSASPIATSSACTKIAVLASNINIQTPKADDIWTKLVAGEASAFRRIFPKLGTGGLGTLIDIPAVTSANYTSTAKETSPQPAEFYIPHIGGVYEYFLKGIQTILRPKGYGEQVLTGVATPACTTGEIGNVPNFPPASGSCKLGNKGSYSSIPNLPPTLASIIESAAQSYNVPPSLILGIMFGEGAFNSGRYQWTEGNVKNWSRSCSVMPNCSPSVWPSQGPIPFFEPYWKEVKDASKIIDPNREPNPCNLVDVIFALAKELKRSSGASNFAGKTCFGISLKTGTANPGSCSWGQSDIETAVKIWQNGYLDACFTKSGGCAAGAGSAACENDDSCEKYSQCFGGGSCSSHAYCIWDIYRKYK